MVVNYENYMKSLRDAYIPQKSIRVQLPPTKAVCPDCTVTSSPLSLINSPVDYCETCDNRGYLETAVEVTLNAAVVDFMSDRQQYPGQLIQEQALNFDRQMYTIHASISDCTTALYPGQNCFHLSKEVIIENENYKILAIDDSTILGQIRVVISKTN